ncbi:MAG: carboxypeptidase-like regulatory domain-containing protein [Armatimonadetes bacterium]|nr:carboxypeptidase-like regulatory domain-containing protein [Armatimonadota bacterium]MDW8120916.1 carboxypeptidase-like regulatory domain-containing protein [Armatimonadota bacterium]
MTRKIWSFLLPLIVFSVLILGCSAFEDDDEDAYTLRGFVFVYPGFEEEEDGTLADDVVIASRYKPPRGTVPFKGATVTVEETGHRLQTADRGAFIFYPLAPGTYTVAVTYKEFPAVKRRMKVHGRNSSSGTTVIWLPGPNPQPRPDPDDSGSSVDNDQPPDDGGLESGGSGGPISSRDLSSRDGQ